MRVMCVARHPFLTEHLCRYFDDLGAETVPCVGMDQAMTLVTTSDLDAVICDYQLLAATPLASWESDPLRSGIPLIAVSLTRHPGDAHLLDTNGVAGFLYLPTLEREDAQRLLSAVRLRRGRVNQQNVLPWPGPTLSAHPR